MFSVDLMSVLWIAVAMAGLVFMVFEFRHVLETHGEPPRPRPPRLSRALAVLWLSQMGWWLYDAAWHLRPVVVTPHYGQRLQGFELASAPAPIQHGLKTLHALWQANPIGWDYLVLLIDLALGISLLMGMRRHPQWLMTLALTWAVIRGVTSGFGDIGGHGAFAPGAFLFAATAALIYLKPLKMRAYATALYALVGVEMLWRSLLLGSVWSVTGLAVGMLGLAWGSHRAWRPLPLMVLATWMAINLTTGPARAIFPATGPSAVMAPWCILVALSLTMPQSEVEPRTMEG